MKKLIVVIIAALTVATAITVFTTMAEKVSHIDQSGAVAGISESNG